MPAIAGLFYPEDPGGLTRTVDACLDGATTTHGVPKAIIAPHAGLVYSGPVAGTVYACLRAAASSITRVVMIGPCHRVPVRGLAAPSHRFWRTPLGTVRIDRAWLDRVADMPEVAVRDDAHADEHCVEVQLPFLQRALDDFTLVPLLAGDVDPAVVDRVLERLWGGPETLVVISSDLSHFHGYDEARRFDLAASRAIERLAADEIADHQACGRLPIKGLIERARSLDLRATTLDLRCSGDTAGPRDRVVGYGGYVFEYAHGARLRDEHRAHLLSIARDAVRRAAAAIGDAPAEAPALPPQLQATRASFVTIRIDGELRGCIGSLEPRRPLAEDVAENAVRAATADPRFPAMTADEAARAEVSVSILSTPRPLPAHDLESACATLRPDIDGVILTEGERRGLFLPQVWAALPEPPRFLAQLAAKAGADRSGWPGTRRLHRFTTESFGDRDEP